MASNWGRKLAAATPEEAAFLEALSGEGRGANQNVLDEMAALRERGEDLANVDEAYMQRAYQPAFERLMQDYENMDRNVLEDMNRRGIVSQGSSADTGVGTAGSEPEAYARMLLARDTKNQLGRNMLEAQNQAVQQKLAQYQGRTAETNQANQRFEQVQAPVIGANVASATDRLNARTGAANNALSTRFGYAGQMHGINSQRMIAGQERLLSGIGAGSQGAGMAAAGIAAAAMF
jgi:hypothetical protein